MEFECAARRTERHNQRKVVVGTVGNDFSGLTSWRRQAVTSVVLALSFGLASASAQQLAPLRLDTPILPVGMTNMAVSDPVGFAAPITSGNVMQAGFATCGGCDGAGCDSCTGMAIGPACTSPGIGLWLRADYMLMWEKGGSVPPLLTTSSTFPANSQDLLTLDAAETRVLFGGNELDDNTFSGFRIELGTWLNASATTGIYGRYFDADDRGVQSPDVNGQSFLGIPFFDSDSNAEDAFTITVPNERVGTAAMDVQTGFRTWEVMLRTLNRSGCNFRVDWIYGYRRLEFDERLTLNANTTVTNTNAGIVGTTILLNDNFQVRNEFDGFDFGFTGHSHQGCWSLDFLMKVALGNMSQSLDINGSQFVAVPGATAASLVGGLFSQESNIGHFEDDQFTWIPEANVNVGYAITANIDLTFGYTFIFVGDVLRAGSSIDRVVDPGLLVDLDPINGNRPGVVRDQQSYWLQGLNFGITGRF